MFQELNNFKIHKYMRILQKIHNTVTPTIKELSNLKRLY